MSTDNPALDERLVEVFAMELHSQMQLARIAADHINYFLEPNEMPIELFWYHVENHVKALVAMANILWTTNRNNPYKQRSRLLRERFGLADEKPPTDLRETRNWFEHFDEKIDDWWQESERRNFADRNVMPKSAIGGLDTSDYARFFDPTTCDLSVFGRSVNLNSMHAYMSGVMQRVADSVRDAPALQYLFRDSYPGLPQE